MIYLNQTQLDSLDYLLSQSLKGLHILFENKKIAEILKNPTENINFFTFENSEKIQELMNQFINLDSFSDKCKFIKNLDSPQFELLVRCYFNIVDNTVFESTKLKH